MKLPQFQHSVSPSMSGAYSQPVQRAQPTMRPVVQRNTSAYLSNPRAGQRDINLEVAAVAAQAKPWIALAEGGAKIAEVFAQQEAEQQLATASTDYKIEVENALSNMRSQPISRENYDFDNVTGKWVPNGHTGTYKTSFESFKSVIKESRTRLMKNMSRAAQIAFAKSNSAYTAGAIRTAESANRKQFIAFQVGEADKEFQSAMNLEDVDAVANQQWVINIYDPVDLRKRVDLRKGELSVDYFAKMLLMADSPAMVELVKDQIEDGVIFEIEGKSNWMKGDGDESYTPEGLKIEYWDHLDGDKKLELMAKADSRMDRLMREDEQRINNNYEELTAAIYDDYNPEIHNADAWAQKVAIDDLDPAHIKKLEDHAKRAILMAGTVIESDPKLEIDILSNISSDEYTVDELRKLPLESGYKATAIAARQEYDRTSLIWWDKTNPDGAKGFQAKDMLDIAFFHKPGLFELVPGANRAAMMARYSTAYTSLNEFAMEQQAKGLPNAEVLDLIYDESKRLIEEERNFGKPAGLGQQDNITTFPSAFTGSQDQLDESRVWGIDNKRSSLDGKTAITYPYVLDMPKGPVRDVLAQRMGEFGWEFPSGFVGDKPTDEELKADVEKAGGIKAWFIDQLKKTTNDYQAAWDYIF